jgi:histidinol-phosphate aminotransferase
MSLPFIRSDVAQLAAYMPHPGGVSAVTPEHIDHLDTNECPYDLPKELKEKLAWAIQHEIQANRYPDGGHLELRDAIATYATETTQGTATFTPDHISVGNGSDELIRSLLIATCLGAAGSILVASPTFSMYGILAKTLGIPVVGVSRQADTFEVNLAEARHAIDHPVGPPVRVVFMVHPNSPTANAMTQAEIDWLKSLPQDILVVVDEAYFEFSQQTTAAEVLQRPNWVVLRTFSKAFRLAAFRVGYGISNPEIISALEKVRLPYNLPSPTQAAAKLALAHRQDLLAIIPTLQEQRQILAQTLTEQGYLRLWPSMANFLYGRPLNATRSMADELEHWFMQLKQQGTLIRQTGGGLRITVGTPEENQRTVAHIQALSVH